MPSSDSQPYEPIILTPPRISKPVKIITCTAKTETGETCNKPLGAETRQYNAPVCKDHRICDACNKEISLRETEHCFNNEIEILKCSRCLVTETAELRLKQSTGELTIVSTTQKQLDELNNARLLITADLALSDEVNENDARIRVSHWLRDQDFDQIRANVKKLNAVLAEASLLMQKDKRYTSVHYAEQKAQLQKEKQISASAHEDRVTAFAIEHNILDREYARKQYAKFETQQAKKTARHFTSQANKSANQKTGVPPQNPASQVSNQNAQSAKGMSPEERMRDKSIRGLMKNLHCSYEYAEKTLNDMVKLKDKI